MTSPASQHNQNPAPNTSASSATSYASAAGANKKPTSTPLIATGSHPPVAVGSVPAAQNGKSNAPPANGRLNFTPAIPSMAGAPSIVRGSSGVNGGSADHTRKSSVTISANAPPSHAANGGPVGGQKANIQFGYSSPAVGHSTPQAGAAMPMAIPGAGPAIPSPAHSPSPIPQVPQHSGGQRAPSNTQAPLTFGSFPGDNDRHMKQAAVSHPMGGGSHNRRDSQASAHGDASSHGGPGHNRGSYGGGRGRGGNFNAQYNNPNMGFPPTGRPYQGQNAGRGGMTSYHQGRGGMQQFPNSPQPPRASPATAPAMLHHGTPTMPPATLASGQHQQFYPPIYPHHQQQVKPPLINNEFSSFKSSKKNKGQRRDSEKYSHHPRPSNSLQSNFFQRQPSNETNTRPRRGSKRWDSGGMEGYQGVNSGSPPVAEYSDGPLSHYEFLPMRPVPVLSPHYLGPIDLSPESGAFEKLLTAKQKQMNGPYPVPQPMEGYSRAMMMPGYPQYPQHQMPPYMSPTPPSNSPAYHQQFVAPYAQGQQAAPAMSRNPSQVSDRPASSTGPSQAPAIAQGTPQQRPAQVVPPPAIVSSTAFSRPTKKSAALVIKNPDGKALDLSHLKAPASPAPSIQQSKTPPVIASTPTPPPKLSTPSHVRSESTTVNKTKEQIQLEFLESVRKQAEAPDAKAKEEEAAKAATAEKAAAEEKAKAEEERLKEEERLAAEKKAAEEAKVAEEAKKAEAEAKAKAEADAAAAAEAAKQQEKKEEKPSAPAEMSDEDLERMIREMEEEDARREKEQAELTAKKNAEKEAAKKRAEEEKLKSAADNDAKLREQEREMERLEEERERQRAERQAQAAAGKTESVADLLTKIDDLKLSDKKETTAADKPAAAEAKSSAVEKRANKPVPLNLARLNTETVEVPQPSAALQSLKSARFLHVTDNLQYPPGIASPNPALNAAVTKKGKTFKYDANFLLQFKDVFTEEPSVEFNQQVKSLIGDSDGGRTASARTPGPSGRQNSRAGPSSFPQPGPMGQFGAPKTLPPGTTSNERFQMSNSQRGTGLAGMSFGRSGAFPITRTPSSTGAGGIPNSPRTGSRRGGSKRTDFGGKNEAQAAKIMPLTAGQELKPIVVSESGWKPTSIGKPQVPTAVASQAGHLDPEMVQRKVKAALNKMTPEKFDKISDQILAIAGQSKNEQDGRTLRQVIQLTFEKATDEAHWANMYARFCKRMLETMSPEIRDEHILDKAGNVVSGGALFRKYLLNRCQEEFERGWKIDLPDKGDGGDNKPGEAALLSEEYYIAAAAKRRGLGLVQFIGELYKLGMLTERIMHECVRKLLEFQGIPDEAEIESLTKLLKTIGANLDNTEKSRPMMDVYFQRIQNIVDIPDLPSRLKFMLMDIQDLRRANWKSKEANKGPKTLEEVRAEAEAAAAQKAAESARNNQRGGPGGRPAAGRGDARNFSYNQPPSNQVLTDDLRKLKGIAQRSASQNVSFGPTPMFNSRSNSGRRLTPGGAFGRAGEDSGASSRTGTPPNRDSVAHTNAFG
ncbi:hypothetical protein QBC46DRAFT_252176 [Diplogelasinospora grovesii]|uniref:MIF4G domain-containing protein n=1 Tax=Diplogelasinospora grovesii TaxID=303347 RepID=A0AAN6S7S5_9PEZI|nr:hypothetical protein QBC46DRAFT_252176 [Diplogelasinospora grovesii]